MTKTSRKYVLLTGTDLGDRMRNLERASDMIGGKIGPILLKSSIFETEPWGFQSETMFLNQALMVESSLEPEAVLNQILSIEEELGRIRRSDQWSSRIIDIDILCADQLIHHTDHLTIPHKHLHERAFALNPLCELVPDWIHPLIRKSYRGILSELTEVTITEKAD